MELTYHLLKWFRNHKRDLPWRDTGDPYHIWLSEILLQQTRVDQGMPYYLRFISEFPEVSDLAAATEDKVLRLWQGLGYYSRARNLLNASKMVVEEYNGVIPADYNKILGLPGVGEYTAAAVSSIAFGLPYAVVDGNVIRVLARLFAVEEPFDSSKGKKIFKELAGSLLNKDFPGEHNQALMEFGALHCTPRNPGCDHCPLSDKCSAFRNGTVADYPVRKQKPLKKTRYFRYVVVNSEHGVLLQKRSGNDIWKGMYQFPLFETERKADDHSDIATHFDSPYKSIKKVASYSHILSHQRIECDFLLMDSETNYNHDDFIMVKKSEISNYPLPRLITRFLERQKEFES